MNLEGLISVKDIEKFTGGNLDIKPLQVDLTGMRKFVHTPKHGIHFKERTDELQNRLMVWADSSPKNPDPFLALKDPPPNRKTTLTFNAYEDKVKQEKKDKEQKMYH